MPSQAQIVGRQGEFRFAIRTADDKGVVVDLEEGDAIRPGMHWQTLFKGCSSWDEPGDIEPALREEILRIAGVQDRASGLNQPQRGAPDNSPARKRGENGTGAPSQSPDSIRDRAGPLATS